MSHDGAARRRDRGSAVVEFTMLMVVAVVPLAWGALALQQFVAVQAATEAAAGEAVRAFVTAGAQDEARQRADVAAKLSLGQMRAVKGVDIRVECGVSACLRPGAAVAVTVAVQAELPEIPVLGVRPALTARAEQFGVVDAFAAQ